MVCLKIARIDGLGVKFLVISVTSGFFLRVPVERQFMGLMLYCFNGWCFGVLIAAGFISCF